MNQHYILHLNPQAKSDWDRCVLRNPLTGERPDFSTVIAQAVENQGGSYLIKVNLEVEILEQGANPPQRTADSSPNIKSIVEPGSKLAS